MIELRTFLARLATDADELGEFFTQPERAMVAADLDEEDRSSLRSGDQGTIYGRIVGDEAAVPTPPVIIITNPPLSTGDYSVDAGAGIALEAEAPTVDVAFGAGHREAASAEAVGGAEAPGAVEEVVGRPGTALGEQSDLAFDAGHREAAAIEKGDVELRAFLARLATDADELGEFFTQPERAMVAADLDEEDRSSLRSGDQGAIYGRIVGDEAAVPTPPVIIITNPPLSTGDYSVDAGAGIALEAEAPTVDVAFGAGHREGAGGDEGDVDAAVDVGEAIIDEGRLISDSDGLEPGEGVAPGQGVLPGHAGLGEHVPEASGLADPDPDGPPPYEESAEEDADEPPL